jgi:hypothetical protein
MGYEGVDCSCVRDHGLHVKANIFVQWGRRESEKWRDYGVNVKAKNVSPVGRRRTMSIQPPFTLATALKKVKAAQDLWNTRTPSKVALAYTPDIIWRNRDTFLKGREQVQQFLKEKWEKEHFYMYVLIFTV